MLAHSPDDFDKADKRRLNQVKSRVYKALCCAAEYGRVDRVEGYPLKWTTSKI